MTNERTPCRDAMFIGDIVIDCFFALDIVLQFFTSIPEDETGEPITDKRKIATAYLKSWFWIDLMSVAPVSYFTQPWKNNDSGANASRLFRYLRLPRLIKLLRLLR
eukprot:SAG11_NODE_8233_length_1044_cov_0.779894_1_plen_106_part_00